MQTDQANWLVRQTFTQAFDKDRFRNFVLELVNNMDEEKAATWTVQYIKDAFKPHISRYDRLATYTSPNGEKLDVLIVYLTEDYKLERTRAGLRNFVADHLKKRAEKDAALVAFVSPSEKQWRFSYVKMEYATVEKESGKIGLDIHLTPARRFSYIVGEEESCHTAQTRFLDLLKETKKNPTLADIEEAFSVEAVTKEFFVKYAELFNVIREKLDELVKLNNQLKDEFSTKEISTVEFSKKLMGQIVFLYFLQKKGWLGVDKGQEWGTGHRNFMRRLASGEYGEYDTYFNDVLEPLFYDTLATDRGHEAWCEHFKCRIPFLNGGLFEPLGDYDWQNVDVELPNRLFFNDDFVEEGITGTGVLDVFDRYNFTVNEAEPLEKEVAIDPEMLGKVFENLIEENRRKGIGAYYTPREIVHYMCQESLINYLHTSLQCAEEPIVPRKPVQGKLIAGNEPKQAVLKSKSPIPREDIETLIHMGEQISHYEAVDTEYKVKMPKSIRANARFIDEKLAEITVCDPAVGSGAFLVGMMNEIVRTRSALTPYFNVVQDRKPYQLKHDAIQNCLYGVDIDPGAVEIAKLRLWLSLVIDEEAVKQIKPLPNLDFKVVTGNSLIGFPYKSEKLHVMERLKQEFFDETDHERKTRLKTEIDKQLRAVFASSKKNLGYEVNFDFEVYFSEVFHKKEGFDITIANPPYVQIKGIPEAERNIYKKNYIFATGRFNLFYLFIERSRYLLRNNGVVSLIIPDRLFLNTQCKKIRNWLLNENTIQELVSFENHVFETAVVDSILLFFLRNKRQSEFVKARRKVAQTEIAKVQPINIPISYFELSPTSQFDLNYDSKKYLLVKKIIDRSVKLYCISETKDGIIQGKVEDQLFLKTKLDDCSRPLLFGKDIERFRITFNENWVNYKPKEMMKLEMQRVGEETRPGLWMRKPKIFERPKILTRQTADEIIAAYDDSNYYYSNTIHGTAITNENFHPYYVLGILNSKITTWYYRSLTDEKGKPFAQIKIELLRKLPIVNISIEEQKTLVEYVNNIINERKRNSQIDTTKWENKINELVYDLYGLTDPEIDIIEDRAKKE
ncbi:N-6 DNA methylase [candidate division WOR-3 bacterium]|nr:N-6 DNA methylase [candidate division WOR-3 bacterium]